MFDVNRLAKIITEVSGQYRKGDQTTTKEVGGIKVTNIYMMPHTSEAPAELEMVDMWFIEVGVDKAKAEAVRDELVEILDQWPDQPLKEGISYISFGGTLGSQDLALRLMAIGKVLRFWKIVSPAILKLKPGSPMGDEMAGSGFVMSDGYQPATVAAS